MPTLDTIEVLSLNLKEVERWQEKIVQKIIKREEEYQLKVKREQFKKEMIK